VKNTNKIKQNKNLQPTTSVAKSVMNASGDQ